MKSPQKYWNRIESGLGTDGCCNWTWPTAATQSHGQVPQDLKDPVASLTTSKNKRWKMTRENPEVSPSPSLIRSWLKFLLVGHPARGIPAAQDHQVAFLLWRGQVGLPRCCREEDQRELFFVTFRSNQNTELLSDLHSGCHLCLFIHKAPLLPMARTRTVLSG